MPRVRLTTLKVRDARAAVVMDDLRAHPELVERVEDVARLPRVAGWSRLVLEVAVADLVAAGAITEAADGRLCVTGRALSRGES